MRRKLLLALVFLLLWPAIGCLARTSAEPDLALLDQEVDRILKRAKTVGASLIIMRDGKLLYARDYGLRDVKRRLPVDENTYFKVGCVTKMVSSLAILQLVDEGLLALDKDISEYFGYAIVNPHFPDTPVTLRQLLSHTSSISEGGGYSNEKNRVFDMLGQQVKRSSNFRKVAPGSNYAYSNFASGLVGSLVELVSGQSVNRFVSERLFQPLGIDAAISASWLQRPEDMASLYANGKLQRAASRYYNAPDEDFPSPETHYRTMVGGLFIRSRDLARLTMALCGDGSVNGLRLLKPETVLEMRQAQHSLGRSVTGDSPYGLFLEHNSRVLPGHTVYGHQGMTAGASTNVYFEPETGFIFVLTNNGTSMARDRGTIALAQNLLRLTYPLFVPGAQ